MFRFLKTVTFLLCLAVAGQAALAVDHVHMGVHDDIACVSCSLSTAHALIDHGALYVFEARANHQWFEHLTVATHSFSITTRARGPPQA